MGADSTETLRVRKIVPAAKERVFRAWTEPAQLKKWWTIGEGWITSSVEVDLKVGGRFSVGNQPLGGGEVLITGRFLAIEPPDRLVYTWTFQGDVPEESTITVEFNEFGEQTEVVITHEKASKEMAAGALAGWHATLVSLVSYVVTNPR